MVNGAEAGLQSARGLYSVAYRSRAKNGATLFLWAEMDFTNIDDMNRLYKSFAASRDDMVPFRENRYKAIEQFVGTHFTDNAADEKVPLPLLQQFVNIYSRLLIPTDPAVMVSSRFVGMRPLASGMETYMNVRGREMRIGDTLRRWVKDAMFCLGILEVGIEASQSFQWEGETHYYGEPFVDTIDFDDYLVDMAAKRWTGIRYEGHTYRVPTDVAANDPELDGLAEDGVTLRRQQLQPISESMFTERGDEKVKSMEVDYGRMMDHDYVGYSQLWQIFMHQEQVLLTVEYIPGTGFSGLPLRIREWKGPRSGPYKKLWFVDVPSMLMPSPPVSSQIDMHNLANDLMVKLGEDGVNQKDVLLVNKTAKKDATKIMKTPNGGVVAVDDPNDFKEMRFRGIDGQQLAFLLQVYQLFSRNAGNLEVIGGLSSQAGTATQEKLLAEQSGTQTKDMQSVVFNAVREVYSDLGWYWWTDPIRDYEGERSISGVEFPLPFTIRPQDREANVYKLNFDVNPYSFTGTTPAEEVVKLDAFVTQIIMPLMPIIQQQGGVFKTQNYLRIRSKLANQPYYDELIAYEMPDMEMEQPLMDVPRRTPPAPPPPANRTVTRRSEVQAGPGRDMQNLSELLRAGQSQNGDGAA